ncbi:MAG: ABC transporter ATP-binding protein, partial [Acidobacteria bacterium]
MSAKKTPPAGTMKLTERVRPGGPGSGRTSGGLVVGQKAMHFGPSAKRMLARMAPERRKVTAVVVLAVVSVALFAVGPRVLGRATDLIFAGLIGKPLPPGISVEQAV